MADNAFVSGNNSCGWQINVNVSRDDTIWGSMECILEIGKRRGLGTGDEIEHFKFACENSTDGVRQNVSNLDNQEGAHISA